MPISTKERWEKSEQIAGKLGLDKSTVFAGFTLLIENGLIEELLAGEQQAIEKALALRWHGYYGRQDPVKRAEQKAKKEFRGNANDVQLMIWAVKKIGNAQSAREAFERAIKALE